MIQYITPSSDQQKLELRGGVSWSWEVGCHSVITWTMVYSVTFLLSWYNIPQSSQIFTDRRGLDSIILLNLHQIKTNFLKIKWWLVLLWVKKRKFVQQQKLGVGGTQVYVRNNPQSALLEPDIAMTVNSMKEVKTSARHIKLK